ncbi:hypothetical protein [Cytobacillus sp. NCCP-133]|uniref:hypothetical protein n=1 Tax=Cytobacillus sp. NCCP-133 TaxID=766848 RepID=UPI0022313CB8|nr:hypothetical protein [Cytobacillus sp. NCCP-133]GLB61884.1 hypothetical protein NCCP133_40130 [Cytobacillus sp. NCCP-133]
MGWAEFGRVKNEYNETFKAIDEKLLELIQERKAKTKGKRFFPPMELMEEWAKKYDMDVPEIGWFFNSLDDRSYPFIPDEPGEIRNVLPIMRKSTVDDFDYMLTHAMQHDHCSVVTLEISYKNQDENIGHLIPRLMLAVDGPVDYHVKRHGSRGGGGNTQMSFLVSPALPDHLDQINFALFPYFMPMENPPKEVVLDKEVFFPKG